MAGSSDDRAAQETPETIFRAGLFAGRHVLVTGGGTGIGFAIARLFGRLGARVTIAARTARRLEAATAALCEDGIAAHWHEVNIRDDASVASLFEALGSAGAVPDVLVNNAGGQFVANATDISSNGFRAVMDLNVQGTWHMTSGFAKRLIASGRPGVIVNIVFEHVGAYAMLAHAAAARAAVVNLTKTLALEWGAYGIRVNAVGPGYIGTEAIKQYDEAHREGAVQSQPIARLGSPEEIAAAVCFLASPASAYTTGAYLVVDGGHALMGGGASS